jgi:SAM-dependent methyltransferase
MKPYAEACERNREPILRILQQRFVAPGTVLEIGSGTGQHAVFFAERLPHLTWYPTDRTENLSGIATWVTDARLTNLQTPLALDVCDEHWPLENAHYAFSANTAHIMSWPAVELMFTGLARVLHAGATFCLYGPFNRQGEFTCESNGAFDQMLRTRDSRMGIRDDRALIELADRCGFVFADDCIMPANNRLLVWVKQDAKS